MIMAGWCCCLRLTSLTLITRVGFSTSTLAYVLDSLVRVSRRDSKNHLTRSSKRPQPQSQQPWVKWQKSISPYLGFEATGPFLPICLATCTRAFHMQTRPLAVIYAYKLMSKVEGRGTIINSYRFLLNSFRSFNSLSSSISSFLHSTCSLSVSHSSLALEEVYPPFRAAIPSNPTLRSSLTGRSDPYRAFTFHGSLFQDI